MGRREDGTITNFLAGRSHGSLEGWSYHELSGRMFLWVAVRTELSRISWESFLWVAVRKTDTPNEQDLCKFGVDFGTFWIHFLLFLVFVGVLGLLWGTFGSKWPTRPRPEGPKAEKFNFWRAHFDTFFDILGLWFLALFRDAL